MNTSGVIPPQRIIPVVVLDDARSAPALADALLAGGLTTIEVTLRTPVALDALRSLAGHELLVGAGSVRTRGQVDEVVDAGAAFVVSPGWSDAVVARCRDHGVPVLPGVATPSEIMRALDADVDLVKLFPVSLLGGPGGVRALAAPFPAVRFVPTGGVDATNVRDYLAVPSVVAVGGSWMVSAELVARGRFDEIRRLAAEAVALTSAMSA